MQKTTSVKDSIKIASVKDLVDILKDDEFRKFSTYESAGLKSDIEYKFPFGIWFRGHFDYEWKLTPSLFRFYESLSNFSFFDETASLHHFQLRTPKNHNLYRTTFDWLCLMQHYDIPTRLLDWSESPLVGLCFAVTSLQNTTPDIDKDAKFYSLNVQRLNEITTLQTREKATIGIPTGIDALFRAQMAEGRDIPLWIDRIKTLKKLNIGVWDLDKIDSLCEKIKGEDRNILNQLASPFAVFPNRLNERMVLQSSMFTIHGGKIYKDKNNDFNKHALPKPKSLEEINCELEVDKKFLRTYIIPRQHKETIREELKLLGIHFGLLFPEIDKQANYIKQFWS